jgi:2-hydroxychromene-2-carboxylate isomerase
MNAIEFRFDFSSGQAYFAAQTIDDLALRNGWDRRPMLGAWLQRGGW